MSHPQAGPLTWNVGRGRTQRTQHVTVGLAAGLVLLSGVVAAHPGPLLLDSVVERYTPDAHTGGVPHLLRDLCAIITVVATPYVVVGVTVLVAAVWSGRSRTAAPLRRVLAPLALLVSGVVVGKALLHRPGPSGTQVRALLGYFPSGHTTTALVCSGTLALMLSRERPQWRTGLSIAVVAWTSTVASALVYHRYHWLTDVLGGALLGSLILVLTVPRRSRAVAFATSVRGDLNPR